MEACEKLVVNTELHLLCREITHIVSPHMAGLPEHNMVFQE